MTRIQFCSSGVLGLFFFVALGGCQKNDRPAPVAPQTQAAPVAAPAGSVTDVQRETKFVTSYAPVVKKVAPAVVNVFTTQRVRVAPVHPFFDDPVFRRFFGGPRGAPGVPGQEAFRDHTGLGSGVIVSKNGYVLTNHHVAGRADEIQIQMGSGGRRYPAKLVGKDPLTDLAVLKIDTDAELPAATLGDSDHVQVGDVVLAIGNPFGLGQTVTSGIISALGRNLPAMPGEGNDLIASFIQTDAPINPGNSGGALMDAEGRLVGINTAILGGAGGGNVGIGFAIPSNLARNVMDQLIQYGKVTRGYLGVGIAPVPVEKLSENHLLDAEGAMVAQVAPGSPAADAGLKTGDIILEFNGKPIRDPSVLRLVVSQTAPGATVVANLLRSGKKIEAKVTLGKLRDAG